METNRLEELRNIDSDNYSLADFVELKDKDLFMKTIPCFSFVEDLKRKGRYSYHCELLSACRNRVMIYDEASGKEREMIMLGSNNYLGLSTHPKVIEAGEKALHKYGSGMGGSRLLSGTYSLIKELETRLAELKNCEAAMVFSTGYSANVGTISGLTRPGDVVIIDKLDHASIIDGCRLSGGDFKTYRHGDMESLERVLRKCEREYQGKLLVTDGVFSMDGDIAPLTDIAKLAAKYKARLMVDEAHATGVVGEHGIGVTEEFGLNGKVDIVMGTFSKAFAAVGGFVASTKEIINYLRYYARSYMFSASLAPSVVATVLAGIEVIKQEPERRERLWRNIRYLHGNLMSAGFEVFPSPPQSAVITVRIGDLGVLRGMNKRLSDEGLFVNSVSYPAVAKNRGIFRISLMATHTREDMDEASDIFRKVGKEFGII